MYRRRGALWFHACHQVAARDNSGVARDRGATALLSPVQLRETLRAVKPVVLEQAETGTIGIGRELGSDSIVLKSAHGTCVLSGLTAGADETVDFPDGRVTVDNRFTYEWNGAGTVCYIKRNRPARVHGAPGGYGRIEDRLSVRHIQAPRSFQTGETIAEGELRVRVMERESLK